MSTKGSGTKYGGSAKASGREREGFGEGKGRVQEGKGKGKGSSGSVRGGSERMLGTWTAPPEAQEENYTTQYRFEV